MSNVKGNTVNDKLNSPLARAFTMESYLAARLGTMALMAEKKGRPSLAALLKALENSRTVRARRFMMLLRGKLPPDAEDMRDIFLDESGEAEAYYHELTGRAGEPGAAAIEQALKVQEAAARTIAGYDGDSGEPGQLLVCQVCGYLASGQAPVSCPVCGAVPERFQAAH